MWKLVFFLPLFILTGYIIYKDVQDGKAEESEDEFKSYCVSLTEKLLQKEDEQFDIDKYHIYFKDIDMSDPDNPSAVFKLENHDGKMKFEVRNGKIIRHHYIKKERS